MGMGYGANYAETIEWTGIKEICPKETANLESVLDKYDTNVQNLARAVQDEDDDRIL